MKTNLRFAQLALVCVLCSLVPIGVQAMTEASSESQYDYSVYLDNRKLPGDMMYVYIQESAGTGTDRDIVGSYPGAAMTRNAQGLWEHTFTSRELISPIVSFSNGDSEQTAYYTFVSGKTYVIEDMCVDGIYYMLANEWFSQVDVTYKGMSYYEHANEYAGSIVLPSTITYEGHDYDVMGVAHRAFQDCAQVTDVSVSEGVSWIGRWAFAGCENLQSITMPKSLSYIHDNAFYYCNALEVISIDAVIPPAVNENTFKGVDKSIPVIVPAGCEDKYKNARYWKDFTNIVSKNEGTPQYTWTAYLKNSQLSGYPMYVYMWDAGDNNKELLGPWPGVVMTKQSNEQWIYTFQTDYELKQPMIIFNNGMGEQTDDLVFDNNKVYELLDEFTYEGIRYKTTSESTVEVVSGAGCSGDVVIPEVVEYEYMNYNVTSIANSAFKGCTQLTSISIPRFLSYIGAYAFDDCPALKRVEWNAMYCQTYREENNIYPPFFNYVTRSCSVEEIVFGNEVHIIPTALCANMKLLKNIELPTSVTTIGDFAFAYCEGLQSVTFPEGLTSIGEVAFGGCTSLSTLTIPRNVSVIGGNAFQDCVGLTSVKWDAINCRTYAPNGLVYPLFVAAAQGGIMNIEKFEFGSQVQIIPVGLCWELSKLQSVEIPQSVKEVCDYAFYRSGLKSIALPSSVSVVGASAFWGCEALESVTLAEGLQEIGNYAFSRCSKLKSIVVPNSVQQLGDEAFWSCSNLQSAIIGDGVTYIGNYTFSRCENLASVVLGKNISTLGQEVFWSCSSLRSITLPESLTEIGQWCFEKCTSLRDVYALPVVPPTICDGTFTTEVTLNATLHTQPNAQSAYGTALYWRDFSSIVGDVSGVESVEENGCKVTVVNGVITIEGVADHAMVNIYSAQGALLHKTTVACASRVELPRGVYFVQVEQLVRKIVM